jgi:hypothetical protein
MPSRSGVCDWNLQPHGYLFSLRLARCARSLAMLPKHKHTQLSGAERRGAPCLSNLRVHPRHYPTIHKGIKESIRIDTCRIQLVYRLYSISCPRMERAKVNHGGKNAATLDPLNRKRKAQSSRKLLCLLGKGLPFINIAHGGKCIVAAHGRDFGHAVIRTTRGRHTTARRRTLQ